MTNRERFVKALRFERADRLPCVEWATWWDKTLTRWQSEGMPADAYPFDWFGLDDLRQFWLPPTSPGCPEPASHGAGLLEDGRGYDDLLPFLYNPDAVRSQLATLERLRPLHERGDFTLWITLEGFFWFPRVVFGIERHLYAFYDEPELYHRICGDLVRWQLQMIDEFCAVMTPDFMTFAEDMSYNHGPMLSKAIFDEFLLPYYMQVIPELKRRGIRVFIDSDGNVVDMVPWLIEAGIAGILPLERQAGTDVGEIRRRYPEFLMLGGFDKMVMKHGEAAMRAEFERLLPTMRAGGFIPSVDHQTPPEVSLENYRTYVRLLREYSAKI